MSKVSDFATTGKENEHAERNKAMKEEAEQQQLQEQQAQMRRERERERGQEPDQKDQGHDRQEHDQQKGGQSQSKTKSEGEAAGEASGKKTPNIATDVADLDFLIQQLQNSPGTLSPGDQQIMDQIAGASQALRQKTNPQNTNGDPVDQGGHARPGAKPPIG